MDSRVCFLLYASSSLVGNLLMLIVALRNAELILCSVFISFFSLQQAVATSVVTISSWLGNSRMVGTVKRMCPALEASGSRGSLLPAATKTRVLLKLHQLARIRAYYRYPNVLLVLVLGVHTKFNMQIKLIPGTSSTTSNTIGSSIVEVSARQHAKTTKSFSLPTLTKWLSCSRVNIYRCQEAPITVLAGNWRQQHG